MGCNILYLFSFPITLAFILYAPADRRCAVHAEPIRWPLHRFYLIGPLLLYLRRLIPHGQLPSDPKPLRPPTNPPQSPGRRGLTRREPGAQHHHYARAWHGDRGGSFATSLSIAHMFFWIAATLRREIPGFVMAPWALEMGRIALAQGGLCLQIRGLLGSRRRQGPEDFGLRQ